MSHEIRTPLGAVMGFSELLTGQTLMPSDRANYAAAIKRNGELLANIINDILDLSKVEFGKFEIERRDVGLSEVLDDIKTISMLQAQEKGLKMSVMAEGPVPRLLETDPLRLRQILLNIVGNAVKFTKAGTIEVKIHSTHLPNDHFELSFDVKDTGPGISAENVKKIFEPFTQGDGSITRKHGGTGLGLVLSKRMANLLGGDVVLKESALGKGSTFRITIDAGKVHGAMLYEEGEKGGLQISRHLGRDELSLAGIKILLVDDSMDNQFLVSRILKMVGAIVDTADNGKAAVEKAYNEKYDVVLMDLQMPLMDGYEATTELRRKGFKTPIIALTAHALKEERVRTMASGFSDHVTKPIDRRALIESIQHQCPTRFQRHKPESPGPTP
jgi:CheY-like chemotaxis protein